MRQNFSSLQQMLPKLSGLKKVSNVCILKAATNKIKVCLSYHLAKEKLISNELKE